MELIIRFLVGGAVVSFFAIPGDALKPKSFAGLSDFAPSVALATISLTVGPDRKASDNFLFFRRLQLRPWNHGSPSGKNRKTRLLLSRFSTTVVRSRPQASRGFRCQLFLYRSASQLRKLCATFSATPEN
jgi:hypothetical protein